MLQENKIIFKVLLTAPAPSKEDISVIDKWANHTKAGVNKMKKGIKNAIKSPKDFDRKITQPTLKTIDAFFKDGHIFKGGISKEEMMANTKEKMQRAAKKYLKNIKDTFKKEDGVHPIRSEHSKEKRPTNSSDSLASDASNRVQDTKFDRDVDYGRMNYAKSQLEYNFPLFGSKEENVKGLVTLGVMALSGDNQLRKSMKKDYDKIIKNLCSKPLCITSQEHLIKFKRELRSLIAQLGAEIIKAGYATSMVKYNSDKLNRLIDNYRLPEIASFEPKGASHIDFIVREFADHSVGADQCVCPIKDTCDSVVSNGADLSNMRRNEKRLALDIQVSL